MYKHIFKRFLDVLISLLCLPIFFIILLIFGPLIYFSDKGTIFYNAERLGMNGTVFKMYKFRSMKLNAPDIRNEDGSTFNSEDDPRLTSIGKFIRKTSIDELPQFFNVLLGDMSVVGPRPHLWSQNKAYANKIKKYMVRHYVKPGITGLAQVKGYRGEIETDEDMINRIKYDVFYIENWSFAMDLKIIFQTVINIFKGEEKAY